MTPSPVSAARPVITHTAALRVVQAVVAKAESLNLNVCVAVVDSGNHLVAFARMPSAFLVSTDIARRKAEAAASIGIPMNVVEEVLQQEAPRVREGLLQNGLMMIRGGLPLRDGEALIGAVGVSGGSEAQDVELAQAGVAALGA